MLSSLIQTNPYLFSLVATFIIEGLIISFLTRKAKLVFASIVINLITHPWAYYLFIHHLPFVAIELLVVVGEIIAWYFVVKNTKKAIIFSLATNVVSALLGVLLT
ncbi:MAG: hypothetical protein V1819_00950 [bacterium]